MKVVVRVSNQVIELKGCYTFKSKEYEVEPFKITRIPCGQYGAARNRYYYFAHFIGFGDMLDCHKKSLDGRPSYEGIIRRKNPKFNPKKLNWIDDVAIIDS